MTDTPRLSANRQIARAASTVMVAIFLSTLTGLARNILIARAFGTSGDLEAFTAANRVAETLFTLVAAGALSSAFIPTFTGLLEQGQRKRAWELASAIANLLLLTVSALSILAAIFAPQVVRYLLAPGFAADPAKESLTISLMRMMLPTAVVFALSGLVMGILNAHQVFLAPALAPSLYALGQIFGVLFLAPSMGIFGLAWGVLIGAALHLGLQLPALFRQKGAYLPILGLELPEVREVGRLMAPRLFGVAVVQLNFWLNIWLASQQPEGSVVGVTYAFTLMLMPQAVIAQSIAIAALPTFSAQIARGRLEDMRASLAASLRAVLLLSIPATVGLVLLRVPIVTLLYQRGEFDEHSTRLVAWALLWYGIGLVGHSIVEVMARAFYAMHDTKTPVIIGSSAMGLNLLFSFIFSSLFARIGWMPHGGLALANTLATALEMLGLAIIMRRRLKGLDGSQVNQALAVALSASLLMGLVVWGWMAWTGGMSVAWVAIGGVALGGLVYALAILALRTPEALHLLRAVRNRMPNRA